jgi:hypothetical protein
VKPEVGLLVVVTVPPVPLMMLQEPVPTVAVFAARVAELPHTVWSGPALAVVGLAVSVITTSSVEEEHALLMVQRKV